MAYYDENSCMQMGYFKGLRKKCDSNSDCEESYLLECDAVWSDRSSLVFHMDIGELLLFCMASHAKKQYSLIRILSVPN
jgi:hypothetical protein